MSAMVFNLQLAVEELADITKPPRANISHDQSQWAYLETDDPLDEGPGGVIVCDPETGLPLGIGRCNGAFCFAGGVVMRSGVPLYWENVSEGEYGVDYVANPDGTRGRYLAEVASELLGMEWKPDRKLPDLFEPSCDLEDLHAVVADLAGIDIEELDELVAQEVAKRATPVG